jgi:hypothetical protein
MRLDDSAPTHAHATSIKDDVESFETRDPQHSPATNASAAAFFATSLGPSPSGDAGLKQSVEAGSAFAQGASRCAPGACDLGMFGRRFRALQPLIGRITTIESERSRPRPIRAVPLVVRRPARIAATAPEARRCLPPRSGALSNRPDQRIDIGAENRDRVASNDAREGRKGCSCVGGRSGDRLIAGQEGLYVYTYRGLIRWQKVDHQCG